MYTIIELAIEFRKIVDELFETNRLYCKKLYYEENIYYCGRDILKCLEYSEQSTFIAKTLAKIRNQDKFTIQELESKYNYLIKYPGYIDLNKTLIDSLNEGEKQNVYINKMGLYFLILKSTKKKSKSFKNFVFYTLFPALDNVYIKLIKKRNFGKFYSTFEKEKNCKHFK